MTLFSNIIIKRSGLTLLIAFCLFALVACAPQNEPQVNPAFVETEIFLVRHAEKTADKGDPALTVTGQARALLLADMLKDAKITQIHSSDYTRTRDTAAPLARRLGLEVQIYDLRDLAGMAERLKKSGGRHLVVGHSNTTPQLTKLLGGDGGTPIVEETEYDRLYYVTISENGGVTTALLRFGE